MSGGKKKAKPSSSTLSLVSQNDDMWRHVQTVLNDIKEDENAIMKIMVSMGGKFRAHKHHMKMLKDLQDQKRKTDSENDTLRTRIKQLKYQLDAELTKNKEMSKQLRSMEKWMNSVKQAVFYEPSLSEETKERVASLTASVENLKKWMTDRDSVSLSDISLDDTADSPRAEGICNRKRSTPVPSESSISCAEAEPAYKKALRARHFSEDSCHILSNDSNKKKRKSRTRRGRRSNVGNAINESFETFTSGKGSFGIRMHRFLEEALSDAEDCIPCGAKMKRRERACRCQDCKATCHQGCTSEMLLPCIPVPHKVKSHVKQSPLAARSPTVDSSLHDSFRMCLSTIEERSGRERGLYLNEAPESDVHQLLEKFSSPAPNMFDLDINVLCGAVKAYLETIVGPIIPKHLKSEFYRISELPSMDQSLKPCYGLIWSLPEYNRLVLALLVAHICRLSRCAKNDRSSVNLTEVFTPVLFGQSKSCIRSREGVERPESKCQQKVMQMLLFIPFHFWRSIVEKSMPSDSEKGLCTENCLSSGT